jgi:hypothetical protein
MNRGQHAAEPIFAVDETCKPAGDLHAARTASQNVFVSFNSNFNHFIKPQNAKI